jgi:hypothetical protein
LTIKLHTHTHKRWEGGGRWCGKCWGYRSLVPVYSVTAHWIESFLIQTVYIFFIAARRWPEKMNARGRKARKRKMSKENQPLMVVAGEETIFVLRFYTHTCARIDCSSQTVYRWGRWQL